MYKKAVGMTKVTFLLVIAIIIFMTFAKIDSSFAADHEIIGNNFGISIVQNSPLFNIQNMAPGDSENSTITIKNQGNSVFSVSLAMNKVSGDDILFQNLEIHISNDSQTSYYNGTLVGLKNIDIGSVLPGSEKSYNLNVVFPLQLGNEFQKKSLAVKLVFTALSPDSSTKPIPDTIGTIPAQTPAPTVKPTEKTTTEEKVPLGELVKTGGTPPEVFYIIGLVLIITGIFTRKYYISHIIKK